MKHKKNQHEARLVPAPFLAEKTAAVRILSALVILFLFLAVSLQAEPLGSPEWGYAVDLPEGYVLADRNGTSRYHFTHKLAPVDLQMALYPREKFTDASGALAFVTDQLSSKGHTIHFSWRRRDAAITQLGFSSNAGWGVSLELANRKGWLVMAVYTAAKRATALEPLLISTLDSVFTDDGSYFEPGPMTTVAWPAEKAIAVEYRNGEQTISVPANSSDAPANQSVVDREYSLLTTYLNTPYVYDAWKRYYRLIYRDAWSRLAKQAFILSNNLSGKAPDLAAQLLAWTQSFTYERDTEGSDFVNLPDTFAARKGDCDSRSLLMVLLLNQMGVDAVLLVSPEYSHAVAAVDCPGAGARFTVGEKKYLIADTTSKTGMGLIAQEMADPAKWFAVTFYAFPQKIK